MTDQKSDGCGPETLRVGVRAPPFWPEEPGLWFSQMEGQFALANITTDATKFYHVLGVLDHRYVAEVKDIITNPPAANKYEKLKEELIKRLSASQERKVKQLLMHEELGDRKPSQFFRHLQHLAGPAVPEEFLKTLWSSRLPSNVQTIVASQADLPMDKMADLADKVHEIAPTSVQHVASAAVPVSSTLMEGMVAQISELTKQVALLNQQVSSTQTQRHERSRRRSRSSNSRRRSTSRSRQPPENHPHCWYHYTYGSQAKKCRQPCQWSAENSMGSRK